MKYILMILLGISTSLCYGQSCKKMYKSQLETDSKLIDCEYNYTIEKLKNARCILKRYYPDNKTIIKLVTFKTDKLDVKHGLYQERWDDGTLVASGMYVNNMKQGQWRILTDQTGFYRNNLKMGMWKKYYADSIVVKKQMYLNDLLNGEQIFYDSLGQVEHREKYEYGRLIETTVDTSIIIKEEMPRFPGCEDMGLSGEELKNCAQNKMLEYIYENIKYPKRSNRLNIQGNVLVQYTIAKDGNINDIKVLNGVSKDIKNEVIKLIGNMPKWKPGAQEGIPVKVRFTMPIIFKLN